MDLKCFLHDRTNFMRYFYEHAVSPFYKIVHAIENEQEPFIPPYSEDGEPPFWDEWIEATAGINTVGHVVLSMVSSSLQLFLREWVNRFNSDHRMQFQKQSKKNGWLHAYKKTFRELGLDMNACPADWELIEQVILARNRIQHPEDLTSLHVYYSKKDLTKFPRPLFIDEFEMAELEKYDNKEIDLRFRPLVTVTKEQVLEAIEHVESLCNWLEEKHWESIRAQSSNK